MIIKWRYNKISIQKKKFNKKMKKKRKCICIRALNLKNNIKMMKLIQNNKFDKNTKIWNNNI
jgi:hypothetical protein